MLATIEKIDPNIVAYASLGLGLVGHLAWLRWFRWRGHTDTVDLLAIRGVPALICIDAAEHP